MGVSFHEREKGAREERVWGRQWAMLFFLRLSIRFLVSIQVFSVPNVDSIPGRGEMIPAVARIHIR